MHLAKAILLRLLYGVLSLLFISFVTFLAGELDPVDAARALAGEKASPAAVERMRRDLGLDRPWPERYVRFLGGAVRGDFGTSYHGTREPVADVIKRNLPMTLRLGLMAILLAAAVGITLGTFAGIWRNRGPDRAVLLLSTLGVTVPNFVLAPILVYFLVIQADLLPLTWEDPLRGPILFYLVLPVSILAARPMAMLTRLTRASMVETLQQEFVRMAVAKGVPPVRLYVRHALRNAILPVVTAIGTSFGFLLTGSFVVETFFSLPGLGRETIVAIQQRNAPVVQACIFVTGALFILINLLVDVLLPILDPRIREAQV